MSVYLQDGSVTGHALWCEQALDAKVADGVIISPFFTPFTERRGQATAATFTERVRARGGEVILDATTHGVTLPGANNWTNYNTWDLWSGPRGDLTNKGYRESHLNSVFARQRTLGVQHLVPTVALDSPIGAEAEIALALADEGAAIQPGAWQSLAGRRGFWLSPDLDNYVGAMQQMRAPVWFITLVRDHADYPPDMTEAAQTAAFCRTVDSLSRRSRVVVCHADLFGLPAIAAGATGLGTGWHTKQRVCSPATFQINDPDQIRRAATWYTYLGLVARLHSNESRTLTTQNPARARALYSGPISSLGQDIRLHHLDVIQTLIATVGGLSTTKEKVSALRRIYETAAAELDDLARLYSRAFAVQRAGHLDGSLDGLREYASAEGIWDLD